MSASQTQIKHMSHNEFVTKIEHRALLLYTIYHPGREAEAQLILENLKQYVDEKDVETLKKILIDEYGRETPHNRLMLLHEWLDRQYVRLVGGERRR